MSTRSYAEINFHITWHTKNNLPFITSRIEKDLYSFVRDKIINDKYVYFHGIGGTQDHVHLGASFYPPFEIDTWIGRLKGASSHEFGKALQWQAGYGIVSFGTRDLKWVLSYINNQKERHRIGNIENRLERIEGEDNSFSFG